MQQTSPPTGHPLPLLAITAVLGLSLSPAAPSPASAASALHVTNRPTVTDNHRINGHVYVGDSLSGYGILSQYPIVNGVMQTTPSATISNAYAPVAVANGELYALSENASSFLVNVYSVPSLTFERSLDIPSCGSLPNINAMTVAPAGDLYVLYECGTVGEGLLYGVLVYPPGASGNQQPLQNIQIAEGDAAVWGVAADRYGRLYVANTGAGQVQVYEHPATDPKVVRTLNSGPYTITIDRNTGELYVDPFQQATINVYPENAHGSLQPQRQIQATDGAGADGMTIFGPYLFSVNGGGVNQLYKRHRIVQTPIAFISDRFAEDVAAGP